MLLNLVFWNCTSIRPEIATQGGPAYPKFEERLLSELIARFEEYSLSFVPSGILSWPFIYVSLSPRREMFHGIHLSEFKLRLKWETK